MKNKKGFTLIELLAVIVILAILVLLAMPAVTSIMESSGRNTFKNEILGVVKTMENAYTEKWGNGDIVSTFDDDTKIHTVTKDDKTYSYLCMSLKQLYDEQYIKKNLGDNYGGYIQMYVGDTDTYTYINTTNGTYYMQGEYGALSASTYEPSKTNNGTEVTNATTCPSEETALEIPSTDGESGGNTSGDVAEYKYWNDNFNYNIYASTEVPSTVYDNYTSLVTPGTDTVLMRTKYENGSPVNHGACLYYGDRLFCLDFGYWESIIGSKTSSTENGETVMNTLKSAMEDALKTSAKSCKSFSYSAECRFGDDGHGYCRAEDKGVVLCTDGSKGCRLPGTTGAGACG